jgi:adenine/guanine phosphoribosyltransferase-like PRPP-binding protein
VGRDLAAGHVLLVDDFWVTGGNIQSAAARLKIKGC